MVVMVVVLVVVVVTCSGSINGSTLLFNLSTTKQLWHSTRRIVSAVWFTNLVGDCAVDNDFTGQKSENLIGCPSAYTEAILRHVAKSSGSIEVELIPHVVSTQTLQTVMSPSATSMFVLPGDSTPTNTPL